MTTSRVQQGLGIDVGGRSNAAKEGACVSASGDSVSVALCQYLYGLVLLQVIPCMRRTMVGIALMNLLLREYYALLLWFLSLVMVVVQLGRKGEARRVIV